MTAATALEGLPADYEAIEPLGSGGQADVWRVRRRGDGRVLVAKLYRSASARLFQEADALSRLTHASIPKCAGVFQEAGRLSCLLLEDVEGVTLEQWAAEARARKNAGSDAAAAFAWRARCVVRHVANALAAVHEAGLAHRDVKPSNVLVRPSFEADPDDPAGVVLIDFGVASDARRVSGAGTRAFFPPERLIDEGEQWEAKRADVFAWGLLVGWLFSGRLATGLDEAATVGDVPTPPV